MIRYISCPKIVCKKTFFQRAPETHPSIQKGLPFPKRQILDSYKLKELADYNFKVDENGRMFYKRVENIVGKGEIACYEQFLLFQQCFLKTCTADT